MKTNRTKYEKSIRNELMRTRESSMPLRWILVEKAFDDVDRAIREYFNTEGFVRVRAPFMSGGIGSCENPRTLFSIDYQGQRLYFRQSEQLYLEMFIPFLKKVWCEGPSFRAERHIDERHLAEFNLYEFEFCGNFRQLLKRIEDLFSEIIIKTSLHADEHLTPLGADVNRLQKMMPPFPEITYATAIEYLGLEWGSDLNGEHEKTLLSSHGSKPLFITHFPKELKFFNMRVNEEDPSVVNSADLILPYGGEAVGAAEREFQYEPVSKRLLESSMLTSFKEYGVGIDSFSPYLDHLKTSASVLHAGCGIGLERVLQFLLGVSDIRKVSASSYIESVHVKRSSLTASNTRALRSNRSWQYVKCKGKKAAAHQSY